MAGGTGIGTKSAAVAASGVDAKEKPETGFGANLEAFRSFAVRGDRELEGVFSGAADSGARGASNANLELAKPFEGLIARGAVGAFDGGAEFSIGASDANLELVSPFEGRIDRGSVSRFIGGAYCRSDEMSCIGMDTGAGAIWSRVSAVSIAVSVAISVAVFESFESCECLCDRLFCLLLGLVGRSMVF